MINEAPNLLKLKNEIVIPVCDKVKAELGEEKYAIVMVRLVELKERLYEMKEQYPNKDVPPPEDEKKRMLEQLAVLK